MDSMEAHEQLTKRKTNKTSQKRKKRKYHPSFQIINTQFLLYSSKDSMEALKQLEGLHMNSNEVVQRSNRIFFLSDRNFEQHQIYKK